MNSESLIALLNRCVVRITQPNNSGTGFFVAPGQVLTCAHVALPDEESLIVSWEGRAYQAQIEQRLADPYPDLALLHLAECEQNHPCIWFTEEIRVEDQLYGYSTTNEYLEGTPTLTTFTGFTGGECPLLTFKADHILPGFSGSPLLNLRTGGVCGMIRLSRDPFQPIGGRAIPAATILRYFPELAQSQHHFHETDQGWSHARAEQTGQATSVDTAQAIEVFYSYAEEDEAMAKKLQKHLILLKRKNIITDWHPGLITLDGGTPDEQTMYHLNAARIILLLVSPDFIFSEEHGNLEVERAMERGRAGEAFVVPVRLRNIDNWQNMPFGKLQALPRNRKPVIAWSNRDAAFAEIAKEIRGLVEHLHS